MSDEVKPKNLYQKLACIRKLVDVIKKDKDGFKFKYSDINEILAKVKGGMEKYGVTLIPEVCPSTSDVVVNNFIQKKTDRTGNLYDVSNIEYLVKAEMAFVWVNNDNPDERITVPWIVVGSQADPSQAFGSGITYCTRYFLLSYFQIAQDNDVDKYMSQKKEAAVAEETEKAGEIIRLLDVGVKAYLADNPEKRQDVINFVKRFQKDGNYNKITEPLIAAKMLNDFKTEFVNEKGEQ